MSSGLKHDNLEKYLDFATLCDKYSKFYKNVKPPSLAALKLKYQTK